MTTFPRRTVAYHLGRLDRESLAAFVADLWSARGFETERDGERVVATHGTGSTTLLVAPGGDSDVPDAVDVIVTLKKTTAFDESRVVDTDDLVEMLGYAVDRETATGLCERHLGASPANLARPPLTRLRRRASSLGTRATPALLLGVVALVGLAAIAVGFHPLTEAKEPSTVSLSAERQEDTPADSAAIREGVTMADGELVSESTRGVEDREEAVGLPPGVTSSGIADVDALARAHRRALSNRSYTVWVDRYWPQNLTPGQMRIQRDIDVAVEGDRYLAEVSKVVSENRTRLGALYHTGSFSYATPWNAANGSYGEVFRIDPRQDIDMTPARIRDRVVGDYLSTPRTNLTGTVTRDGLALYRIVGSGTPQAEGLGDVHNYSVVALVDSRGFVRHVQVEFEESSAEGRYHVRRTITYGQVGTTTVSRPSWFERPIEGDST